MAVPAAPWKVLPQGRLVPEQRSQPQVDKRETEEGKKRETCLRRLNKSFGKQLPVPEHLPPNHP